MTLEQALAKLQDTDVQARVYAIRWLRVLGGRRAVDALIGALDDPDPNGGVPFSAMTALGQIKAQEAVPILMERVQRNHPAVWRSFYIKTLGEIGDRRALPVLIGVLDDPEERTVRAACEALGDLGDRRAVPVLIRALEHSGERIAETACGALSSIGDPGAIESLLRLLDDPRWVVRFAACEALFELKATDDRLSAALEELAQPDAQNSPAPQIYALNVAAVEAADRLDTARQRPAQAAPLSSLDPQRAERLERGAQRAADGRRRHYRLMIRELARRRSGKGHAEADVPTEGGDESAQVRSACAAQLEHFPGEHVSEALRRALADPDPDVVHRACIVLGERGDQQATPLLLQLLEHPDRRNRLSAAKALVNLRVADQRLVEALERLAQDPDADEDDLEALEFNADLDWRREIARGTGEPEPQHRMTMAELVERSRWLLAQEGP